MHVIGAVCLFLSAIVSAAVATWVVRAVAIRLGVVNHPNAIVPQHTKPVAYLGGVGILAGLLAGLLIATALGRWAGVGGLERATVNWRVVGLAGAFLALGLVDDLTQLRPRWKLSGQFVLAVLAAVLGVRRVLTGVLAVDTALSVFWILLLVNAFNVTDVCDGLVGGIALIVFAFFGFRGDGPLLSIAAAGACAGFLWLNAPPASIFLGDAGSHLLGFLVAALTLLTRTAEPAWPHVAQMAVLLGVPLFEVAFLLAVRIRKGLAWWRGSPDHFSLRLQAAGLSRLQTDLLAWSVCAALCVAAAAIGAVGAWGQAAVLALVVGGLAACGRILLNWDVAPDADAEVPEAVDEP